MAKGKKKTIEAPETKIDTGDMEMQAPVEPKIEKKPHSRIYSKFLSGLSSNEFEVYSQDEVRAMPSFRKFLETLGDSELADLIK